MSFPHGYPPRYPPSPPYLPQVSKKTFGGKREKQKMPKQRKKSPKASPRDLHETGRPPRSAPPRSSAPRTLLPYIYPHHIPFPPDTLQVPDS